MLFIKNVYVLVYGNAVKNKLSIKFQSTITYWVIYIGNEEVELCYTFFDLMDKHFMALNLHSEKDCQYNFNDKKLLYMPLVSGGHHIMDKLFTYFWYFKKLYQYFCMAFAVTGNFFLFILENIYVRHLTEFFDKLPYRFKHFLQ